MASSKFLEPLPEVTDYESPRVEATTLNPIPQNIPNRLSDLLSHLPKLIVVDSICWPLESFTLFPDLPKELRLKIWELFFPPVSDSFSRRWVVLGAEKLEQAAD
jgi:hypothetical protein